MAIENGDRPAQPFLTITADHSYGPLLQAANSCSKLLRNAAASVRMQQLYEDSAATSVLELGVVSINCRPSMGISEKVILLTVEHCNRNNRNFCLPERLTPHSISEACANLISYNNYTFLGIE